MRILHTSDWHLGRTLYGKQRYIEFRSFLNWIIETIESEKVDLLLISGDIFDTATPGTKAQELYYDFLYRVSSGSCSKVVITSGNHDSPTFLAAPGEILKHLNIHIVSSADIENIDSEIIEIEGEAVVAAVPYLRDRDIRVVSAGESIDEKALNLINAISDHYKSVADKIEERNYNLPVIAMGHLFATGGKTFADDGVRELYVGTLSHVGCEIFSPVFDYVALGHLHVPQKVGGYDHIRYSGSPLPMGFGEAKQKKRVIVIEITNGSRGIREITVPVFQKLERITGNSREILAKIETLKDEKSDAWLEIEYKGRELAPSLQRDIEEAVAGSELEVRVIKNRFIADKTLQSLDSVEELEQLSPSEVFKRCMDSYDISMDDQIMFNSMYNSILEDLNEV